MAPKSINSHARALCNRRVARIHMQVVIDYNNIPPLTRSRGLRYIAEQIARCLGPSAVGKYRRLQLRFYDGWYQLQTLTHLAQTISAEMQQSFPLMVTLPSSGTNVRAVVVAEMAFSLHCDPHVHIWHTFRQRIGQANVMCKLPPTAGCVANPCTLASLPSFFSQHRCPGVNCTLTTEDLIVRDEQKLVDTMMVADLLSLHLTSTEELVIVSSDDDLWPAMRLLLHRGHTLYHIHTNPVRSTPPFYLTRVSPSNYIQLHL